MGRSRGAGEEPALSAAGQMAQCGPTGGRPPPPSIGAPPWTVALSLAGEIEYRRLPARPGLVAFESESGDTIALAATANVRRMVRRRLAPVTGPARRIDYRPITRQVRALTVGSEFESDWVYLQLARTRLPKGCRSMRDRCQAWFLHCDPADAYPRWVRTSRPDPGGGGVCLGPFASKQAAGRYIELLEDLFDLCRYHHLLVQAPGATACAYKEMGRCPAPCDGSVSMDDYRRQMMAAIEFGSTPREEFSARLTAAMDAASARLEFERAEGLRRRWERSQAAARPEYAHVDRLERFRYLAVQRSEQAGAVRLIVVLGGWVQPWLDLPLDPGRAAAPASGVEETLGALAPLRQAPVVLDPELMDNVSLVAFHLFRADCGQDAGSFLKIDDHLDGHAITAAVRKLCGPGADPGPQFPERRADS